MKVLTYNVRNWLRDINPAKPTYWRKRAKGIKAVIEKENPDVILLQEALFPMVQKCVPKGYRRVSGLSISHHIYAKNNLGACNSEWHLHWTKATIEGVDFVSVHSHWDKKVHEKVLLDMMAVSAFLPFFAAGDWNNEPSQTRKTKYFDKIVGSIISSFGVTFKNWKSGNVAELDYAITDIRDVHCKRLTQCGYDLSDHLPIIYAFDQWSRN